MPTTPASQRAHVQLGDEYLLQACKTWIITMVRRWCATPSRTARPVVPCDRRRSMSFIRRSSSRASPEQVIADWLSAVRCLLQVLGMEDR